MSSKLNQGLFSSTTDEWATPQATYDQLNKEFGFTLDPCSTIDNHKCNKFYTISDDGLSKDWGGESVFCNPPFSQMKKWVSKCSSESKKPDTKVVMLIPSRTDTSYFHDYIYGKAEIRFIRGRLHYNESKSGAPFPSMIVVF